MADVHVTCPHCGNETKISEYADANEVDCPSCGKKMGASSDNGNGSKSKLSLKKPKHGENRLTERTEDEIEQLKITRQREAEAPDVVDSVHDVKEKVSSPKIFLQWFMLLLVGGGMFGLLYAKGSNENFLTYYTWFRNIVGPITYVIVIIVAFQDSSLQGVFCVLFLPYAIYYVLVRADSYILRGLVMGLVVGLGAEAYYLGDASVLAEVQKRVNGVITGGENLIDKASDAPKY